MNGNLLLLVIRSHILIYRREGTFELGWNVDSTNVFLPFLQYTGFENPAHAVDAYARLYQKGALRQ
jgi:hypothetical protein